jgi:hypothetical protein
MNIAVHRRQFVISKETVALDQDWRSVLLSNEFHLSYHNDLRVRSETVADRRFIVIGDAFSCGHDGAQHDLSHGRSGRFAWIEWPYLYQDSSALLPIYYADAPSGPLITSSLALAAKLAGADVIRRAIKWGAMNWTPPPDSFVAGVRKLLRDQRLFIPSASVEFEDRAIRPAASFDEAKTLLASDLTNASRSVGESSETVYLALTAGLDSRTLLSSLLAAGVKFQCVTQTFQGVNRSDIEVAAQISRYLGVPHHVIGPKPRNDELVRAWREHTFETYRDADDAHLIPQDQYRFLQPGATLVRGGCFELGRRFYASRLKDLTFENASGADLWARFESDPPDAQAVASLDAWLAWRRTHPNGLDLVDAYYLDQRVGGWLSALEHGLDMLPGISVPLANSGRILSSLVTPGEADRRAGRLQREVIGLLEPNLLRFPVNPVSFGDRAGRIVRRTERTLKQALKRLLPTRLVDRLRSYTPVCLLTVSPGDWQLCCLGAI